MERIVVGMDGSATTRDALEWAVELARATGAEVIAVNAHTPGQSELRPGHLERLRARRQEELATWCADVFGDVPSTLEVVDGDPRNVIPAAVSRHGADLLVVASSGERSRGPGFLRIGSVVEHLAHHLDRPLAVITPGAPPTISRILVGVDGSDHGHSAISWVAHVAEATGANVTGVAITEPKHPLASPEFADDWRAAAERELTTRWAAPLGALGDRFRPIVTETTPVADTLIRLAGDEHADVVVVGARGLGGIRGLRIGGTALGVLHRTKRPVVLVPSDPQDH
ncbi:MAG: universal stress protein [Ilumatobacteraceae bacterium]